MDIGDIKGVYGVMGPIIMALLRGGHNQLWKDVCKSLD